MILTIQSNDERILLYMNSIRNLPHTKQNIFFGGRLGEYKYYDMDKVIASALEKSKEI